MVTDSIQDYLKAIYDLTRAGEMASTNALAERLGVEPASVTGMVQKLAAARQPLVDYRKRHGVKLTAAGRRAALEVIRHHRLLEAWLVTSLGYSWDEVHSEAEKLEHVISEDFEERIAAAMGHPVRDPHGEPIPSADLVMPADPSVPLANLQYGQKAIVRRVDAEDHRFLRHLAELNLVPGARIKVTQVTPYDRVVHVSIEGGPEPIALGPAVTERIFVEPL